MERKYETELETLMQRELRRLPLCAAPPSLAPRVLAAIQSRAQAPWWKRPLWTWPRRTQWLVALLFLTLLVSGLSVAGIAASITEVSEYWADWSGAWSVFKDCGEILRNAAVVMVLSIRHTWLVAILGTGIGLYLFCLGTGTLFYRLAVKRI
jgi:hypothetical protein